MAAVWCDLEDFAAEMFEPFSRADQRRWGGVYLRGLLLDGGRKSVEPMAARLGEDGNRQALAHFVTSSPWDAAHVRARLAWRMQPVIKPTALVIDDTGFLKDGDASACWPRQQVSYSARPTNPRAAAREWRCHRGALTFWITGAGVARRCLPIPCQKVELWILRLPPRTSPSIR